MRTSDTVVARLGRRRVRGRGDGQDEAVVYTIAARMREVICEPIELSGVEPARSTPASGSRVAPADGTTWESLLAKADAAMYVAKRTGSGIEFYTEERDGSGSGRLALLGRAAHCPRPTGELDVHFQPVYSLVDGAMQSTEALVRWPHTERGMLAPAEFLPVAVEAGLGRQLTDEVLRLATQQAARWLEQGHGLPVAVNLFESDLTDSELVVRVAAACDAPACPLACSRSR